MFAKGSDSYVQRAGMRPVFRSARPLTFTVAVLLLFATPMRADIYGRVTGIVKDPSGASVPDAAVKLLNVDTGVMQQTTTDERGSYSFPAVPVGHFDVEVKKAGFADSRETGLIIDVNTVRIVDVFLRLPTDVQQVTVENNSPVQVETASTQMGEVISDEKMTALPLNGRSYTDLLSLQPGVAPVSSGLGYNSVSVNGGRESSNGFIVNGGNVEEGQFMGPAITPNLDSIAEFRIITNTFDAEYGEFSGAQVNVATKSGTDKFHGSAFEFLRNTALDATQYFSPGKTVFIQNQFGGTFGGPIVPHKLFFFADYQETRSIQGQSTGQVPVPTASNLAGDFSAISDQLTGTVNGAYWADQLSQKLHYKVTNGEPYYASGCTSSSACVFPNAQIPAPAISPIATNLLPYIPTPLPGEDYFSSSSEKQRLDDKQGALRIDSNSRIGNISVYYYDEGSHEVSPYYQNNLPGFPANVDSSSAMFNLGYTRAISPRILNEFRLHVMHLTSADIPGGTGTATLSSLGFVTGAGTEGIVVQQPNLEGVPQLFFNNFSTGVPWFETSRFNTNYQLSDDLSIVRGTHSFKFGAVVHDNRIINKLFGASNGSFTFSGSETGSDIADFLLGAPGGYAQGNQMPLHMRAINFGVYGEDSWRFRPNLTVNYGLRWDVPKPWSEKDGHITTLVPGQQSQVFLGAPKGLVFPGDPGVPNSMAQARYNNLAPRLGIAYSPSKPDGILSRLLGQSGRTSIHAGFGIFYTVFEEQLANNEIGDAPFGDWYQPTTPSMFATPFIDRPTGFVHGQPFPVPPLAPASPSHPNTSVDWSLYKPVGSSPGFWYKNKIPYTTQYNLSIQRGIGTKDLVELAYVGSQGHALISNTEANAGNPKLCLSLSQSDQVAVGSATCGPFGEDTIYTAADGTIYNGLRSPLGSDFTSDGLYKTIGNSSYNSFQSSWKHRSGSLEFLLGYTFSKSIDSGSGYSEMINPANPALNRGLSAFDVPHNFVASYQYQLPFNKLKESRLTSGWAIAGITHFASGLPITLSETDDHSLLGTTSAGAGSGADTPVYTPGPLNFVNPRLDTPYFNTSLFKSSDIGQIGTSKVRFFHGPGLDNTDVTLTKETKFTESTGLQFRFELFNAFNHAQFLNPSGRVNNPSGFGRVTQSRDPRIGQVALKFRF